MAVEYIGKGGPDGVCLGSSTTELVGFYGTTPVAQRSGASQGTFTSTMVQTTGFGFETQTAADAAVALLEEIRATLIAVGLFKGSE